MADTGAPYFIPYVEPTDLVRDYPAADEASADAIAAALDAAGGLVAVKSAIFTGIQSASVTAGSNLSVTNLTITHEVANASNKLIISAFVGSTGSSGSLGSNGLAIHDGSGFILVGAADGSRSRISAGGYVDSETSGTLKDRVVSMPAITCVHTPGAGSKTYTVRLVNIRAETYTIFVNRASDDDNTVARGRSVSSLVIQEVRV